MPSSLSATWKLCAVVFTVAVALNFAWEMLQAPLYRMDTGRLPAWLHCFRASLFDGLIVFLVLGAGAAVLGGIDWFRRPGWRGYAWMAVSGLLIAVVVEWTAVELLERWSYEPAMPLLPGLKLGLVPIAQMVFLPPAVFAVAVRLAPGQRVYRPRDPF